jgi:hypothetical protein
MRNALRVPRSEYSCYVQLRVDEAKLAGVEVCPCCFGSGENLSVQRAVEQDDELYYELLRTPCALCRDGTFKSALKTWCALFIVIDESQYPTPKTLKDAQRLLGICSSAALHLNTSMRSVFEETREARWGADAGSKFGVFDNTVR